MSVINVYTKNIIYISDITENHNVCITTFENFHWK